LQSLNVKRKLSIDDAGAERTTAGAKGCHRATALPAHGPVATRRARSSGAESVPPEVVAATQRERLFDGLVHTVAEKGYVNAGSATSASPPA
jgi:hypothetical protein